MPILRGNALRSFQSSLRFSSARASARAAGPARTHLVAKRFASSGSGGHGEASSDIPWMIGALVVTPPSMWYLWPAPHDDHHEDHGHEEHAEEEKPSEENDAQDDEAPPADSASGEFADEPEQKSGDNKKDEDGDSEEGGEDKSDSDGTVEKEGAPDKDPNATAAGKVQFKGKVAEGSAAAVDERKSEPRPSKDSRVKRIDSGLGKNLGEGPTHDEESKKETQATSKDASKDPADISAKQKGLSTTDTRHSTQIDQDPEKSKKGSGEPETAKAKGTVDPNAPVR